MLSYLPLHHPLQLYDGRARRSRHPGRYPRILFLVTGRGPQRQAYEERMQGLDLRYVAFRWGWLLKLGVVAIRGRCICISGLGREARVGAVEDWCNLQGPALSVVEALGWQPDQAAALLLTCTGRCG